MNAGSMLAWHSVWMLRSCQAGWSKNMSVTSFVTIYAESSLAYVCIVSAVLEAPS